MTKYRASITIDNMIAKEIEEYYRQRVKQAVIEGDSIPKLSNVYEEIIAKGWKSLRKEFKKH